MSVQHRTDLVALTLAAGGVAVIPVRQDWLLHEPFADLTPAKRARLEAAFGPLRERSDVELGQRFDLVDEGWCAAVDESLVEVDGRGILARWRCQEQVLVPYRRLLLQLDPRLVALLGQLGKRWATLASTSLKNWDAAAESWGLAYAGEIELPIVRQPPLVALR